MKGAYLWNLGPYIPPPQTQKAFIKYCAMLLFTLDLLVFDFHMHSSAKRPSAGRSTSHPGRKPLIEGLPWCMKHLAVSSKFGFLFVCVLVNESPTIWGLYKF